MREGRGGLSQASAPLAPLSLFSPRCYPRKIEHTIANIAIAAAISPMGGTTVVSLRAASAASAFLIVLIVLSLTIRFPFTVRVSLPAV